MEPRYQHRHLDRQPSVIRGGAALLFERLCSIPDSTMEGLQPADKPFRAYELQALAQSVVRELQSLLNTRLPVPVGQSDESSQTTVNYGLPDFSLLNAASPTDRDQLAALIEKKIAAFEPRLRQVRVILEPDPSNPRTVTGTMQGLLQMASISEPVTFPVVLGNSGVVVQYANYARR